MRANGATMTQGERVAGRGELVAERGVGVEGIAGAEERADIAPEHVVERAGLLDRIRFVGTCHSRSRIETGPAIIVSVNEPKSPDFSLRWRRYPYMDFILVFTEALNKAIARSCAGSCNIWRMVNSV